jgi:hypothetical protein
MEAGLPPHGFTEIATLNFDAARLETHFALFRLSAGKSQFTY